MYDLMSFRERSARPFVKWAGGKSQIVTEIENLLPKHFQNYFEPFVGGGAVFFHLYKTGRLVSNKTNISAKKKVILNDKIHDLITTYRVIKNDVESLIKELSSGTYKKTKSRFIEIRKSEPSDNIKIAARFIYLNKTCYNGLWRVNKNGKFNEPYADNQNATILDASNLNAASVYLRKVSLYQWDYKKVLERAKSGDLVYLDPPYYQDGDSSFTGYTAARFNRDDQIAFAEECAKLDTRKCNVLISNSEDPFTVKLFKDLNFEIKRIKTKRMISCKPDGRSKGRELLIWNYD